jgi:diphthine-ammonia ligase
LRVAVLYSGGKDSNYALFWAIHQGWEVPHLVSVFSTTGESWMYQVPGLELTRLSARAVGIDHVEVEVDGTPDVELIPLRECLAGLDIDGIISGALRSEYQRRRLDQICDEIGICSFSPLWHTRPGKMLREMVEEGWDIRLVSVSSEGLGPELLGKRLDGDVLDHLEGVARRYRINIDGEGGEFETVVLGGPGWRGRVEVVSSRVEWHRDHGTWVVGEARVVMHEQGPRMDGS